MKANELRIGNVLQSIDGKTAYKILCFYGESTVLVDIGIIKTPTDDEHEESLESLEPIPLTEEWLLKFGFELEYKSEFRIKYTSPTDASIGYDWHKMDVWGFRYFGKKIKCEYVHQLQNLYFALTGEELTIK